MQKCIAKCLSWIQKKRVSLLYSPKKLYPTKLFIGFSVTTFIQDRAFCSTDLFFFFREKGNS